MLELEGAPSFRVRDPTPPLACVRRSARMVPRTSVGPKSFGFRSFLPAAAFAVVLLAAPGAFAQGTDPRPGPAPSPSGQGSGQGSTDPTRDDLIPQDPGTTPADPGS